MRLMVSKSKNAASLYVVKSTYDKGTRSTKVVEKLGTEKDLRKKLGDKDPYEWAKEYIAELNKQEKENTREVMVKYSPIKQIPMDENVTFNGGYLFLQQLYHQLDLHKICADIQDKYKISYSLNDILSRLVYGRILFPASKKATFEQCQNFMESPTFDEHHIYRALEILSKESDFIQANLYKNSQNVYPRNKKILFYDCTNFFFSIEQEEGLKKYGYSKDHQPSPIVQMGLFMDASGIPLAMSITPGNTNEQTTLKPLERKILKDFDLAEVIVCTDAGLSSNENRIYNTMGQRSFITTQSVKKLKDYLKEWALSPKDWKSSHDTDIYNLNDISNELDKTKTEGDKKRLLGHVYYKERWIKEGGLEQRLIVTYSPKYAQYQASIRNKQVERAEKLIQSSTGKMNTKGKHDVRRFIESKSCTTDGEIATKSVHEISQEAIDKESMYDGFYAVCTNLESDIDEIIRINKGRWEIEESFRIMKTDFKSRPVYLQRDDRIQAHFLTCFISLMIYRLLEKKLDEKYSTNEIISCLKDMNLHQVKGEGYIPSYMRTNLTDDLHEKWGFRTDYEIVTNKEMKKILKQTKS